MLQPSRSARCRGSACKACAFFLHPYRVTARSEQGGSHRCCNGSSGRRTSGRKPARSWRSSPKNHRVDSGQSPTTSLQLACRLICYHTSPSTIPIRFRSCRKVRKRLPFWSLHPLFRSCYTRLRHLWCRFRHRCSFLRRAQPIPIQHLSEGGSRPL